VLRAARDDPRRLTGTPIDADTLSVKLKCAAAAAIAISLLAAGCGGSSATPRTAAGVREDYRSLVALLARGEGEQACDRFVSAAMEAAIVADKLGSCPAVFETAWTKSDRAVRGAMAALKVVSIYGDLATLNTDEGRRTMVYVDRHWRDDTVTPGYTVTTTDPQGHTFAITRNPDGSITRTCHPAGAPGCSRAGTW
jgi:hypothetical protein